jgi:hypothetical protein
MIEPSVSSPSIASVSKKLPSKLSIGEVVGASRLFIANFGASNYLWPTCLKRATIATFELASSHPFSDANDKEGFVLHSMAKVKTARGLSPTRSVASRWYNVGKIIEATAGDIWIHRALDDIWWTISLPTPAKVSLQQANYPGSTPGEEVYETHKPSMPWTNKNLLGQRLSWGAMHLKARAFLATEATLQQLGPDNSAYTSALLLGNDISKWHNRADWQAIAQAASRPGVTMSTPWENAAARMAMTALSTTSASNGQQELRTVKNKEFRFASTAALEEYLLKLRADQEGLCALSGLVLQYDGHYDDASLLCSLDRIDSAGHYEAGNLQIVCRFINQWKSDQGDHEFRRLMKLVRECQSS